ncbi:MAG TPA: YHS domain-containing protein [Terriglobales bacterium]|nr:YHS domain-containing protein [Terriglobales bacterium]
MQKDPVCNMQVDEKNAAAKVSHNGKDYYFCSQQCADKFRSNPQQYTGAAA